MSHPQSRAALRNCLAFATALCLSTGAMAQTIDLVSAEEVQRDRAAPQFSSRSVPTPGAPTVELLSPTLDRAQRSPMDIKLRWATTQTDAAIDPSSFRVLYGRLGLDITARLLAAVKPTATGLDVVGAKLPSGEHRLTVEISDTAKRIGRREFKVLVEE
jgi:hypothetical protein